MRVLVCGGRSYADEPFLRYVLDYYNGLFPKPFSVLIHGAADGADKLAEQWAHRSGVPVIAEPAKWKQYGRSAGTQRNVKMLHEHRPDLVIAFPGGFGTAHMCKIAEEAGVQVCRVKLMEAPIGNNVLTLKDGDYYVTRTLLGGAPDRNRRYVYRWPNDKPVLCMNYEMQPWLKDDESRLLCVLDALRESGI